MKRDGRRGSFTSETGRAAQAKSVAARHHPEEVFERANEPGRYTCEVCGETLSGPSELYIYCPARKTMTEAKAA